MPRCYAPGCNHGSDKCRLYRYPADPELFQKWISLCRRENRFPTREDRLCSCHFINGQKENLPTVFACFDETTPCPQLLQPPPQGKKPVARKMTDTKKASEEIKVKRKKENKFEDFTAECRACLKTFDSDTGLINILEGWPPPWDTTVTTIADDLANISNVQISIADNHSKVICKACYGKLHKACLFRSMVHENDVVLRKRDFGKDVLDDSDIEKVWPKPIQLDKNINGTVFVNAMEVQVKQEVVSDEELDTLDTNISDLTNMTDFSNLDIKIEPEEILDQKPSQFLMNGTILMNELNTHNLTNGDANYDMIGKDEYFDPVIKEEPLSEDEESESVPDLSLECQLCTKVFSRVSGLKAHVIAHHSYKTVKRKLENTSNDVKPIKHVCAICRRSFVTSTDLMVHETCHNKAVCYGCSAKFDTFEQLTEHRKHCKAILSKTNTAQKLKTLDDVLRPHLQPETIQLKEEPENHDEEPEGTTTEGDGSLVNYEDSNESSMKIHLEIHSLGSESKENDEGNMNMEIGVVDENH